MRIMNRGLVSKVIVITAWMGIFIALFHFGSNYDSRKSSVAVHVESKPVNQEADQKQLPNPPVVPQNPNPDRPAHGHEHDPDRPAHDHEHEFFVKPFDPGLPKLIILLAYQRVGSTFIGEMFNKNPSIAYTYEPLDGTYMHMYGTKEGWAVPLDMHFHWNGTYRPLPAEEREIVADHIEKVLACDFNHVITEFLIHRFWHGFAKAQTRYTPYSMCLKSKAKEVNLMRCRTVLDKVCRARVGQDIDREKYCFEQLIHQTTNQEFIAYKMCLAKARASIERDCVPKLQSICDSKAIHAIKTVRLDMDTIQHLVDIYPNLRIIHLIRDPRPVVLSRMKAGWATLGSTNSRKSQALIQNRDPPRQPPRRPRPPAWKPVVQGHPVINKSAEVVRPQRKLLSVNETSGENEENFEKELEKEIENAEKPPNDFAKEAKLYCELVLRDMRTRQRIETKHKGTTYQMIYEHMVYHPQHEVERVYEFLSEPVPDTVRTWAAGSYKGARDSKAIAQKWQEQMTVKTAKQIDSFCQDLYEEIEFAWPDSD